MLGIGKVLDVMLGNPIMVEVERIEIEGFSRDFVLNKLFETRNFKCLCYWKCVRLAYINTA